MALSICDVNSELSEKLKRFFHGKSNFVEANPGKVILPEKFKEFSQSLQNFAVRNDDVWVISYPRTGSTWAQEMVWLLGNNLDFDAASKNLLAVRAPILELSVVFSADHTEWMKNTIGNSVECLGKVPSPRFARSHLPWGLLPTKIHENKPKIIYTARNPKDLCVSYYHYMKLLHGLNGSFEEFSEMFMAGEVPMGSYWNHVKKFWEHRHDENILFLKYETMKKDLPTVIKECAKFMGRNYEITEEDLCKICDHLKFDRMQHNPSVNLKPFIKQDDDPKSNAKFIRKGQIGDWKNYFTDDLNRKFDKWIEVNSQGSGLTFEYE